MKTYDELLNGILAKDRLKVVEAQLERIETKLIEFLTTGDDKLTDQFLQSIAFPYTPDFSKLEVRVIAKKLNDLGYRTSLAKKDGNWAITVYL